MDYVEAIVHHQAELAVFISTTTGPLPQNRIKWYWPNGEEIEATEPRVTFQETGRRLILSGLRANDSGSYRCQAIHVLEDMTSTNSTAIQLKVLGKRAHMHNACAVADLENFVGGGRTFAGRLRSLVA